MGYTKQQVKDYFDQYIKINGAEGISGNMFNEVLTVMNERDYLPEEIPINISENPSTNLLELLLSILEMPTSTMTATEIKNKLHTLIVPDMLVASKVQFTNTQTVATAITSLMGWLDMVYRSETSYPLNYLTVSGGVLYRSKQSGNKGNPPSANASWWEPIGGSGGGVDVSAYVYIGYAWDTDGLNFSLLPGGTHIAVLTRTTALDPPVASDFAGLWRKYVGTDGEKAFVYIRYATNSQGVGIDISPAGKTYIAILTRPVELEDPNEPSHYAGSWMKYIGEDGTGAGDMMVSTYDPDKVKQDVYNPSYHKSHTGGDVTGQAALLIQADKVTNEMLKVVAKNRFKGRGGTGSANGIVEDLTPEQAKTILGIKIGDLVEPNETEWLEFTNALNV